MTSHGQPNQARAARYILKDYVSVGDRSWCLFLNSLSHSGQFYNPLQGQKLLFCHPPPGTNPVTFNTQLLSPSALEKLHTSATHRTSEKSHPKPPVSRIVVLLHSCGIHNSLFQAVSMLQFDNAYFQKVSNSPTVET